MKLDAEQCLQTRCDGSISRRRGRMFMHREMLTVGITVGVIAYYTHIAYHSVFGFLKPGTVASLGQLTGRTLRQTASSGLLDRFRLCRLARSLDGSHRRE